VSHITVIDIEIRDLDCLRQAAEALGLEFRENQKTFKWYGTSFDQAGVCDHAIGLHNNPEAYEVGVIRNPDKPGYQLKWDLYRRGHGLQDKVGDKCAKLCQKYAEKVVMKGVAGLKARGWSTVSSKNEQGEIVVRCVKG
jgi:hypothetical protein